MDAKLIDEAEKDFVLHLNRVLNLTDLILSQDAARQHFQDKGCTPNDLVFLKALVLRISACLVGKDEPNEKTE